MTTLHDRLKALGPPPSCGNWHSTWRGWVERAGGLIAAQYTELVALTAPSESVCIAQSLCFDSELGLWKMSSPPSQPADAQARIAELETQLRDRDERIALALSLLTMVATSHYSDAKYERWVADIARIRGEAPPETQP